MGKYKNISIGVETSSKVIGYFVCNDFGEVFCSKDAIVIAGSEKLMREHIGKDEMLVNGVEIKKVRFGEIMQGIKEGVEHAFDREAYGRFFQLAKANGLPDPDDGFLQEPETEAGFIMVKLGNL